VTGPVVPAQGQLVQVRVRPWWELQELGQELMLQAPLQELPAGISSSLTFDVRSWLRESLVYIEAQKFIRSSLSPGVSSSQGLPRV
jgi:hypothetical protein